MEAKMATENLTNETGENNSDLSTTQDYISAINEIKANSVDKEMYLKLKEENKKLLNALVKGETIDTQVSKPKASVSDLRTKLFSGETDLSNLDYIKTSLKLREALIEAGEADPFIPTGTKVVPEASDIEKAQHVADVLQECVDYAGDDSEIFTTELQRRTIDTAPMMAKYKRKF